MRKKKFDYTGVLSSVFAIVIGLLMGLVILMICNPAWCKRGGAGILLFHYDYTDRAFRGLCL